MLDRRTTLLALIGAGFSRAALARALGAGPAAAPSSTPGTDPAPAAEDADRELKEDLARLGAHEYSDEGIPVFLACVDLVAESRGGLSAQPSSLSRSVGSNIRRYGDAWQAMHPDAPDTDVSKVIEVLAERDFAHGGLGEKP